MNKQSLRTSVLLASLLAVGGFASAQTLSKGDGTDNKVKAEAAATAGTAMSDKARADVKAEARADNKAMPKNKTGEGADLAAKTYPAGDAKARADVKAEAKAPLKTGEGADKGTNKRAAKGGKKVEPSVSELAPSGTPAARADAKAEAKAANKMQ